MLFGHETDDDLINWAFLALFVASIHMDFHGLQDSVTFDAQIRFKM
jgi:hypothetical protein